jgi:glucokinase
MRVLAIDIGGTKSALGICSLDGQADPTVSDLLTLRSSSFKSLIAMISEWQRNHPEVKFDAVGAGVAGPVVAGSAHLTNLGWTIQSDDISNSTGKPFRICNDIQSHGWSVLSLPNSSLETLNLGSEAPGPKALIAAGTGLGESIIGFDGRKHFPMSGEGGHSSFSPCSARESRLLEHLRGHGSAHVSWERILGGSDGFRNLAIFQAADKKISLPGYLDNESQDWGANIFKAATEGDDFANDVLSFYAELYGREAGNLALKCLCSGGLYIGGGIAPKILPWLKTYFMAGFCDKGRFEDLLSTIPVRVVLDPLTGLKGAALQFCH